MRGCSRLVSNVTTGSTAGHGSASKIIITVQSFVILSLSFWIVEEYLIRAFPSIGRIVQGEFDVMVETKMGAAAISRAALGTEHFQPPIAAPRSSRTRS